MVCLLCGVDCARNPGGSQCFYVAINLNSLRRFCNSWEWYGHHIISFNYIGHRESIRAHTLNIVSKKRKVNFQSTTQAAVVGVRSSIGHLCKRKITHLLNASDCSISGFTSLDQDPGSAIQCYTRSSVAYWWAQKHCDWSRRQQGGCRILAHHGQSTL